MPQNPAIADRVRAALSGRSDVVEKRMVGGISFSVSGRMACGVTGGALMVRVGSDALARTLAEDHVRPMHLGGKPLAGFVLIDAPGFATDEALASWVRRGIDLASSVPAKRTRISTG